jgi:acetyl/propionyl-CoA carboxylase alpha subunit
VGPLGVTDTKRVDVTVGDNRATLSVVREGSAFVIEATPTSDADGRQEESWTLRVTPIGPGLFYITDDDRAIVVHAVSDGETSWVFVEGHVFEVAIESSGRTRVRRQAASGHESLSAPMPATVVSIPVHVGQTVTRGVTLIVLEAMKMELALRAPHDAVVETLRCREGDLVQPGVPLVDLGPRHANP